MKKDISMVLHLSSSVPGNLHSNIVFCGVDNQMGKPRHQPVHRTTVENSGESTCVTKTPAPSAVTLVSLAVFSGFEYTLLDPSHRTVAHV